MNKKDFIKKIQKEINDFKKLESYLRKKLKRSKPADFTHIDDFDEKEILEWEIIDCDRLFYIFQDLPKCSGYDTEPWLDLDPDIAVKLEFLIDYYYIYFNINGVDVTVEIDWKTNPNPINIVIPTLKKILKIADITTED